MKNLILKLMSVLAPLLLVSQMALATDAGGSVAAGENPYDEFVPGGAGGTDPNPGEVCSSCLAHAKRVNRWKHSNPGAKSGAGPGTGTPSGTQSTQE
jgi:hypothetical protein